MSSDDKLRLKVWAQLSYHDPEEVLRTLRQLQREVARSDLPTDVRNLRKREYRKYNELRQAALFCYGISQRLGWTVLFSPVEDADHDAICKWTDGDGEHYTPLQLKELPPLPGDQLVRLNELLSKLAKYVSSAELQVAIYLNSSGRIDLGGLSLPTVPLGGVYLVGAIDPAQREWMLIGDLLQSPESTTFTHPEPP